MPNKVNIVPFLWESNTSTMIMLRIMTTIIIMIANTPPITPPIKALLFLEDGEPG